MTVKDTKDKFLDLKVQVFYNKRNGQMSLTLPKKKFNKMMSTNKVPKHIGVRITKW